MTRAEYFDLINRAEREESLRLLVQELILSEKAMAPGAPFRLALADYVQMIHVERRKKSH